MKTGRSRGPLLAFLLLAWTGAAAAQPLEVRPVAELEPAPYSGTQPATHRLSLELFFFRDVAWEAGRMHAAAREALTLVAQCGIRAGRVALRELAGGPPEARDLSNAAAERLLEELRPPRPAIFFVRDTRKRPAFDAEAFGTGNSRRRPALAGSVWLTLQVRDTGIALAHELAHVLLDSGEHVEEKGNLMREDTTPGNTTLTPAQCGRMKERGTANGWLQPIR